MPRHRQHGAHAPGQARQLFPSPRFSEAGAALTPGPPGKSNPGSERPSGWLQPHGAVRPRSHTCLRTLSWICSNSQRMSVSAPRSQARARSASASLPRESRKRGELGMKLSSRIMTSTGPSPATASQRHGSSRPGGEDRVRSGGPGWTESFPVEASEQPHLSSRASPRDTSHRKHTLVAAGFCDLDQEGAQGLLGA